MDTNKVVPQKLLDKSNPESPTVWLRSAADRHERAGRPVLAQLFRNEAYLLEKDGSGLHLQPGENGSVLQVQPGDNKSGLHL